MCVLGYVGILGLRVCEQMPDFPRKVIKILSYSNMSEKERAWTFECMCVGGRMHGIREAAAAGQELEKRRWNWTKQLNRRLVIVAYPRLMLQSTWLCIHPNVLFCLRRQWHLYYIRVCGGYRWDTHCQTFLRIWRQRSLRLKSDSGRWGECTVYFNRYLLMK